MFRPLAPFACAFNAGVFALALLVPAAHAAWSHDPTVEGLRLDGRLFQSAYVYSTPDASGGLYTVWKDGANSFVFAQHTSASGALLWGNNGIQVSSTAGLPVALTSDAAGGAIVVWLAIAGSSGLAAQRLLPSGATAWASPVVVSSPTTSVGSMAALTLAGGPVVLAWSDIRGGTSDIYAQCLTTSGSVQWTANGVAVCNATGNQILPDIVSDAQGGTLVSWQDIRGVLAVPYVQHLNASGTAEWSANGVALSAGISADQFAPVMVADARGGAIVAWYDWRNGNGDVYAQHVSPTGSTTWTANGVAVTNVTGDQTNPTIVSDGASGAVLVWQDGRNGTQDIYAQRLSALGTPTWAANGVALSTAAGNQHNAAAVSDGSGGAIVCWLDQRHSPTDDDLFAQRVTASGAVKWTTDGVALSTMIGSPYDPGIVTDGRGGAFVTYANVLLSGAFAYTYAHWVDEFGMLGGAAPAIVSVSDVPNDQGGVVQVCWTPSWLDAMPGDPIATYWIYRQVPQAAALAALRSGAARVLAAGEAPVAGERAFLTTTQGTATYYWDYLNTCNAEGRNGYSFIAGTRCDSIAGSNPYTLYMIEARYASVTGEYWDSAPDSGYSVDNLAPAAPAPFTGTYAAGTATLTWGANAEGDLAGYRVYRGSTPGFAADAAHLAGTTSATTFADAPGAPAYYKLSAVDVHGNESGWTLLRPAGTTDAGPGAAMALSFAAPSPNPARERCELSFTLPAAGPLEAGLFDVAGRRVRTIASGSFGAGEHRVVLELRDAAGRPLAAGVYLARYEWAGRTYARRLAVIR